MASLVDVRAGPAVCFANHYQFLPGQQLAFSRVESRMLLWCLRGAGELRVDGRVLALTPGRFLLLPWAHAVAYRADRRRPWLLGGVHLVPRLLGRWRPGVAHGPQDASSGDPARADDPTLPGHVVAGDCAAQRSLLALAEHLALSWRTLPPDEATARAQGLLVLRALRGMAQRSGEALPAQLRGIVAAVTADPARVWDVDALARVAGCGRAWLARLFRRHLRCSPRRWIEERRLELARTLIERGDLPVAQVAAAVGIADAARFSRRFRAVYGQPPSAWRSAQGSM